MALARIKTWARELMLSADINAEFNNILNNALSLISPLTGNLNANSNQITNLVVETVTATPSGTPEGRIVYHTTLDQLQVMDGATARIIPTLAGVSQGDMIYAATANQLGKLNIGAAGTVVRTSGTIPAWGQVILTSDVTGVLPTANGGTGLATVPVGGLAVGQGSGAMLAIAAATTSGVLYATSASATPSWQQHITLATANLTTLNLLGNALVAGYYEAVEIATPSAPTTNSGRVFFADNGAGKTQLQVRFPSGAVQVLATEP